MALFEVNAFSETLWMSVSMNVIIPQQMKVVNPVNGGHFEPPYPVLFLLHGWNGDHTVWLRRTSIDRYASEQGIAVIMPAAHLSFYTNMAAGFPYWDHIAEEVPGLVRQFFPQLSQDPAHTYAAGLSMGGYGAFKLGLTYPERFRAVVSLSGALDVASMTERIRQHEGQAKGIERIYGEADIAGSENDLFHLARNMLPEDKAKLDLYQWCGTEDPLYEDNVRLKDHLNELDFHLTYEEGPGDHTWEYWDRGIKRVLEKIGEWEKAER